MSRPPPPRIGGNDREVVPPVRTYGEEKADEEVGRQDKTQRKKEEGRAKKPCTYVKGGVCRLYGKGAVSKWRPIFKNNYIKSRHMIRPSIVV